MQSKKFADTDFFLALIKDSDWLKERAKKLYEKYKGNIWITPFTIAEIMIICQRENIPIKETLFHIARIAKLVMVPWECFFKACNYIEQGATIFDSLLMAFCDGDSIIGSDDIYKKFGFDVINLKE